MADFLDKITEAVEARRDDLCHHLRTDAAPGEAGLKQIVLDHWCALPDAPPEANWAAYAVDGSVREVGLDNGSYLYLVQALCIGDAAFEETRADVQILPPATPRSTASRFADLLQRHHELALACQVVAKVAPGSVVFLDGALYGVLPQLYPLSLDVTSAAADYPEAIIRDYLELLATARQRDVRLVAVAKTSREATHCKLWLDALDIDAEVERTDSEMIHHWTDGLAGVSVPVILGRRGFTGGSHELLSRPEIASSPAVVSFFVRLAAFDDALRIDVPADVIGVDATLADLEGAVLDQGVTAVRPVLDILTADYGGLEVYNALLYSVDREVRLRREIVSEVYLPLIEDLTGSTVRRNRSERRF